MIEIKRWQEILSFKWISYLLAIAWVFMFLSVSLAEGPAFKTRFQWLSVIKLSSAKLSLLILAKYCSESFYYVQAFPCIFPLNCRLYLSSCFPVPLSMWKSLGWFQFPFSNRESNFWLIGSMLIVRICHLINQIWMSGWTYRLIS